MAAAADSVLQILPVPRPAPARTCLTRSGIVPKCCNLPQKLPPAKTPLFAPAFAATFDELRTRVRLAAARAAVAPSGPADAAGFAAPRRSRPQDRLKAGDHARRAG